MPLFIAFEGGEGSGKSTQVKLLADWLTGQGQPVFATYEPGATSVGKAIRSLLLETDEQITPRSEALLFAADRAHHVETELRPMLADGRHVLCDRYIDSSIAYQGTGRTLSTAEVARLSQWATEELLPDLTVLLDIDPVIGLARAGGGASWPDRLERERADFHQRVRAGFLQLAQQNPARYLVLDATRPAAELAAEIAAEVSRRLAGSR
ncbi:MAG TPA: dTMP kinase [Jatrophihabitans sp.]|jgi:dTMP kinase|nr:dTMP kinase [Jatrophihabitans sp.]